MRTVRVAAHVHSEWSYDAEWPLPAIAEAFGARGYDVVLMAEHDRTFDAERWEAYRRACAHAGRGRVLLVPGMEYESPDRVVHLPVWGEEVPFLGAGRPTAEVLEDASAAGGFGVLAHPWRRDAVSRLERGWLAHLGGIEIWNRQYDGVAPHPHGRQMAADTGLLPFVALDFHTRRQFFPLSMLLEISGELTVAAVISALHARRCRPAVGRLDAMRCTGSLPGGTLWAAERARRRVRGPVRRAQARLGRLD